VNGCVAECFNKNADFFLLWIFICIIGESADASAGKV
jgi:hypothetical protein